MMVVLMVAIEFVWSQDDGGSGCNEASLAAAMRLQITRSYERQLVPPRLENQTDLLMWLVVRQVDCKNMPSSPKRPTDII